MLRRIAYGLYSLVYYLIIDLVVARLLVKSIPEPLYRQNLRQRFGDLSAVGFPSAGVDFWVHAVSAGETNAAAPLVRRLLTHGTVLMTHSTATGHARSRELFGDAAFHAYLPYDLPDGMARFIRQARPRVLVIVDTELWPNMLARCREAGVPSILVNGRMSARSAAGYARVGIITRSMLDDLSRVAVQTDQHLARFLDLGLPPAKGEVAGSLKFDLQLPEDMDAKRDEFRSLMNADARLCFVAASTHAPEEQIAIDAYRTLSADFPDLLLVLVPRHPNRFDEAAGLCQAAGLRVVRRTSGGLVTSDIDVLLVDTMGELFACYAAADVAFVGGSLMPAGGHNMMEAAAFSLPILMGPHLDDVEDIARWFEDAGALQVVRDGDEMVAQLRQVLADPELRGSIGARGEAVMAANRGAVARVEQLILGLRASPD